MRLIRNALIAIALMCLALPGGAQNRESYKIRLFPVPTDGQTRANIAGGGSATAVLAGTKLTITGTFEGLVSPATQARLHRGLAKGLRGSPFQDLTVAQAASGAISGSVDLTPDQVESLRKGQLYVQINSQKAPDGNLWGWLLR